jgi:hypothetical protein
VGLERIHLVCSNSLITVNCFEVLGSIPSLYNGFILGDFFGQNSEIEGRLAAKGDCILSGRYDVATELFLQDFSCTNAEPGGIVMSSTVILPGK